MAGKTHKEVLKERLLKRKYGMNTKHWNRSLN